MIIEKGDPSAVRGKGASANHKIRSRRVRDAQGRLTTVYELDINSGTIDDDLFTVFKRNVSRARRQTQALAKKHGIAAE